MVVHGLQQLEREDGLAGQIARLFDQHLHELSVQHDDHAEELERNSASWKSRYEKLETTLEHEKQHWQSHLSTKVIDTVLDLERVKDELEISQFMVAKLKEILEEKDEQLLIYRESVNTLESLLDEEKERQTELASGYQQITIDTRQTLNKVSAVNKQLRILKFDTSKYQMQGNATDLEVRQLQNKLEQQSSMNHKLAVELAAHRKKASRRFKENECKGCEALVETQKQMQLLRGCIPPLVAQVLELKDRLHIAAAGKEIRSSEAALQDVTDTNDLNPNDVDEEFVPSSTDCGDTISALKFVPVSNLDTHPGQIMGMGEEDTQLAGRDSSTQTLVQNTLRLVESETLKKLEGHANLTRKMESLRRKLESCKQAMEKSEMDISRSGATTEQLRYELRKTQETNRELEAKLRKRVDNRKKNPTGCLRIKDLLANIEMLETESTLLKHELMVQKERQIGRLERELQKARNAAQKLHDGPTQHEKFDDEENKSEASSTLEKVISDLESIIVSRDSLILELRFEVDMATWKLEQVEKRFDIMFRALDCKKLEFDSLTVDSVLENIFSSSKVLNSSALSLLKEKVLARRGYYRSDSKEKELEGLVQDLLKVVEKVSCDNEKLSSACEDTVKHMEKNKELRRMVEDLQSQISQGGRLSPRDRPNFVEATRILDLRSQLSDLADANAGLLRALRDTEEQCSGLKQMVQEQVVEDNQNMPNQNKERLRKSKRICFSDDEHRKQDKRLQAQADQIIELERLLTAERQVTNDIKEQMERKESELDLVYGKLSIKMLKDDSENIEQNKKDLWSFSKPDARHQPDDTNQPPEDFFDKQYLVEHDHELTKAENKRLRKYVTALQNPELLEEIRDLKSEHLRMTKVNLTTCIACVSSFKSLPNQDNGNKEATSRA